MHLINLLVICAFFGPAFSFGPRSIYLVDLVIIIGVLFYLSSNHIKLNNRNVIIFVALHCLLVASLMFGNAGFSGQYFRFVILWFLLSYLINISKTVEINRLINIISICGVIEAVIIIMQVLDHRAFSGGLGVSSALSIIYSYPGELSGNAVSKAFGYQLAVGAIGRATGSFDGQPILAGDFMALVSLILFNHSRFKAGSLTLTATLLTLSRGSVIAFFVALIVTLISLKSFSLSKLIFFWFIVMLIIAFTPFAEMLSERLFYSMSVSQDLLESDPRLSVRWPDFISELGDADLNSLLFGIGYVGPTDSGWLNMINKLGLFTGFLFASFYLWSMRFGGYALLLFVFILLIVHPALQGVRFVVLSLVYALYINHQKKGYKKSIIHSKQI